MCTEPETVTLYIIVEYLPERKQFYWEICPFINYHLQELTFQGTPRYLSKLSLYFKNLLFTNSVGGISALADINADITFRQPDNWFETVTYELRDISLYDDSNNIIPDAGVFAIDKWYYDQPTEDFSSDHDFQIVVVRSKDLQGYINSFDERMEYLLG